MPVRRFGVRATVDAEIEGRSRQYNWRKVPSQVTTQGLWFDLSMSPGNPPPKYWFDAPPGVARVVSQSADGGIFHGAAVAPDAKKARIFTMMASVATGLPMRVALCDYLLYYPSIDDSTTDAQVMDNTVTLPRNVTGAGVQAIAVSVAGRTGGQSFNFSYTNSDGVSGRTSQTVIQNAAAAIGTIVTSATASALGVGPFIGLQDNDTGIRSIDSVTMLGSDVGLFSLILVKPLAFTQLRAADGPYEKDFLVMDGLLPPIPDDAYLSMLCLPNGSLSGTVLMGYLKCIWS